MEDKWRLFFKNYAGYLAVFLVSSIFVSTAFVTISETGKSISKIFADGVVAFLTGILINRIFDMQGIVNGDRDERVLATVKLHNETVDRCTEFLDRLDHWCDKKNSEALKKARTRYLFRAGMRYTDYFTDDGIPKAFQRSAYPNIFQRFLKKMKYLRAVKLRVTNISAGLLISDTGRYDDPYFMGRSKSEYMKSTMRQDVVSKIFMAFLFGYYGVTLIQDFSYAALIWTLLQIVIFIAMGVIKMQQSCLYVTDEYRGRLIKKIDILQLFEIEMKQKENQHECKKKYDYDPKGAE